MNNGEFLDPSVPQMLTEEECEVVSFFRFFDDDQRAKLFGFMFNMAKEDDRTKPKK